MLRLGWRFAPIVAAFMCLTAAARPAAAQSDSAAARALFSEGRELMAAEKYAEACPKFEESLRLDQGMGTQFNLAHCWEKLGRTASAWALFLDVAAAARAGNQPDRETAAKERAAALEPKLTRLRITFPEPALEAKIYRNGQEVRQAAWGTPMPVDPGSHLIRATARGKQDWTQEVKVPATSRTFSVTVPVLDDLPSAKQEEDEALPQDDKAAQAEATPRDQKATSGGPNVPALVIGGVGVAALVTGTVFALQGRADNNEALKLCRTPGEDGKDHCLTPEEQVRHDDLVADARREQNIAYVSWAIGGAAVITSTILFLSSSGDSETGSFALAPAFALDSVGATLSGRF
jgi:tetratricopeptide (TPR) repeat protein